MAKKNFLNIYKQIDKDKITVIPNSFNERLLEFTFEINNETKIKNSFIYFTDLDRGFELLLDCLLYMEKFFSDLSLIFFKNHQLTDSMKQKLTQFKTTKISQYSFVNQDVIFENLKKSEYFFYPLMNHETFCCCAIEVYFI